MTTLALAYDWLRGLHILAVIFWMAGLLYLPRLYVYHFQARPGGELEQTLILQQRRLYRGIMTPAMIAAWLFGILLLLSNAGRSGGWVFIHTLPWAIKLLGVIALTGIHGLYGAARRKFAAGERPHTEKAWRLLNEAPTVLAIVIVLVATVGLR
jgi:putative membrane protein